MTNLQVSVATIHRLKLVRDTFFLGIGVALMGIGLWDYTLTPKLAVQSLNSDGLLTIATNFTIGLVMALVGIVWLTRDK